MRERDGPPRERTPECEARTSSNRTQAWGDHATEIADIGDLLDVANEALRNELLPSLPRERRYVALMVANAIAIAARECTLGADADRREVARLRGLASDIAPPSDPAASDLPGLRRAVSAAIRDGRFDDPAHAKALMEALVDVVCDRVAISNPKALRK